MADGLARHADNLRFYTARNWPFAVVGGYIFASVLLLMATGIDVRIPCLFKTYTGLSCLGCGMTRAFQSLIEFDFHAAVAYNPLIFIVLPAGTWYFIHDFRKTIRLREEAEATGDQWWD